MDREVARIRSVTKTTDEEYEKVLAAHGDKTQLPRYFESKTRLLGVPLFAIAWGGYSSDKYRAKPVVAWIAVGDVALSPFVAFGGLAVAPIAMGAISIGVLSLSVFWGVAVGVLAAGSLAFGWWALGCAAVGWKCAVGFVAVAREFAVGLVASAQQRWAECAVVAEGGVVCGFQRGDRRPFTLVARVVRGNCALLKNLEKESVGQ